MKLNKIIPFVAGALLMGILSSCGPTPYAAEGAMGGYDHRKVNAGKYAVKFTANGYTTQARADDFALLRGCELLKADGYSHIIVLQHQSSTGYSTVQTPGIAVSQGSFAGNSYFGTTVYSPGSNILIRKPTSYLIVEGSMSSRDGASPISMIENRIRSSYDFEVNARGQGKRKRANSGAPGA